MQLLPLLPLRRGWHLRGDWGTGAGHGTVAGVWGCCPYVGADVDRRGVQAAITSDLEYNASDCTPVLLGAIQPLLRGNYPRPPVLLGAIQPLLRGKNTGPPANNFFTQPQQPLVEYTHKSLYQDYNLRSLHL
jgi:hypothetical protein